MIRSIGTIDLAACPLEDLAPLIAWIDDRRSKTSILFLVTIYTSLSVTTSYMPSSLVYEPLVKCSSVSS